MATSINSVRSTAREELLYPFNDFSFKYIFRRESHKDLLIAFLNDLFQGEKILTDIEYRNSELQAESTEGKACLFDILCTDQNNDKYLIEVQTVNQNYIAHRMLHYAARLYVAGVEKGDQAYERIKEVIVICITLFKIQPPKFKTEYELIDNTDLSNKLTNLKLIFLQIPRISDNFEKCSTLTEQWIFIMRNINKIDDNIIALRKEYARLVEVARVSALTEEEQLSYYRAQHNVACLIDGFETAKSEGWEEGVREGLEEGREEGRNEGRVQGQKEKQLEIAKALKKKGIDLTTIVACTQLTEAEISEL